MKNHFLLIIIAEGDPDYFFDVPPVPNPPTREAPPEQQTREILPTGAGKELTGQNHSRTNQLVPCCLD